MHVAAYSERESGLSPSIGKIDCFDNRNHHGRYFTPRFQSGHRVSGTLGRTQRLQSGTAFDPATSRQHFSLGMSDDFQIAAGPLIAKRLAAEAPRVSVTFRQANKHRVEALFEAGEIDFAVVAQPNIRFGLQHQEIGQSGSPASSIRPPAASHFP